MIKVAIVSLILMILLGLIFDVIIPLTTDVQVDNSEGEIKSIDGGFGNIDELARVCN